MVASKARAGAIMESFMMKVKAWSNVNGRVETEDVS